MLTNELPVGGGGGGGWWGVGGGGGGCDLSALWDQTPLCLDVTARLAFVPHAPPVSSLLGVVVSPRPKGRLLPSDSPGVPGVPGRLVSLSPCRVFYGGGLTGLGRRHVLGSLLG